MSRAAVAVALAIAIASSLGAPAAASSRGRPAAASSHAPAAPTLQVNDRGKLRYRSVAATSILDEGSLSGTLPGHARVDFLYDGSPNVTARFTIYASGGAIYGKANCRLHDPASPSPSFKGALQITGGSGRYTHAGGSGELYGVFYRRGYGLSVQATGELRA